MVKKTEKTTKSAAKSEKKSKKKDELKNKDSDIKELKAQTDDGDEDLLLIEDDEFSPANEELDEDVEFLMSGAGDSSKSSSVGGDSSLSAAEQAQQDNAKTAFEGITASNLKNFRHHPDIENFYRFVFDNDLRIEALSILDENIAAKKIKKALKDKKEKVH